MNLGGSAGKIDSELAALRLMHLADSALPIGALAHSFGLESLVERELLKAYDLPEFFGGFLDEVGFLEAVFCREGWRLGSGACHQVRMPCADTAREGSRRTVAESRRDATLAGSWLRLNERLSAMRPARESREGSASLGRNFLAAVAALEDLGTLREALEASKMAGGLIHHSAAFGLAGGTLAMAEDRTVLAYLHQSTASLISACQRLLPLGQSAATKMLWDLKPAMLEIAERSAACALDDAFCFTPLLEWAAMEHPALTTRLFIS
jgi:urease accessory protein